MAEANDLKERLEGRVVPVTSILSIMECSICLEVIKIPFKQCKTGHVGCSDCIDKVKECPLCKEVVFQENPICMKQILESLPRPCRYSANGCAVLVEPDDNHETFCKFRFVKCHAVMSCDVKVPLNRLSEHHTASHSRNGSFNANQGIITSPSPTDCSLEQYIFVLEHTFLLKKVNSGDLILLTFYIYPIDKEPEEDYFMHLDLKEGFHKMSITLKANQPDPKFPHWDPSITMRLHRDTIELFTDPNGRFSAKFLINRTQ